MLTARLGARSLGDRGFSMIEVLIALVVLAIGILGLAAMMSTMHGVETESYQRSQAVLLLQEMSGRLTIAGSGAAVNDAAMQPYETGTATPLGTGDGQPANCDSLAVAAEATPTPATQAALARCQWSNALKGAAEVKGGNRVGAMIGAQGCIEKVQTIDTTSGVCTPGRYRITVAWQGLTATAAQGNLLCGKTSNWGGNDALRRVVSVEVMIPLPRCV